MEKIPSNQVPFQHGTQQPNFFGSCWLCRTAAVSLLEWSKIKKRLDMNTEHLFSHWNFISHNGFFFYTEKPHSLSFIEKMLHPPVKCGDMLRSAGVAFTNCMECVQSGTSFESNTSNHSASQIFNSFSVEKNGQLAKKCLNERHKICFVDSQGFLPAACGMVIRSVKWVLFFLFFLGRFTPQNQ